METKESFQVVEHGGIDPETESPRFVAKHLSAYQFALRFAKGKALELGFGDGYGSSLLAERAEAVTGIDLFQKNVDLASAKYRKSNLNFLKMSATELTFPDHSFDLIVSFQVIEHIPQAELPLYTKGIRRVLKPGGKACISTLNLLKNRKPGQPYEKSEHHDKEFTPKEFQEFLAPHFSKVTLYGLYPTRKHFLMEKLKKSGVNRLLPAAWDPVKNYYSRITFRDFEWLQKANVDDCVDLMAVCE